ncbi:MAG: M6 family metalloprotease domain-containing protein, partial [Ignavibacteria bacterium]|nr:M6 family metalloprotease domain-containing protein [Ignavibacteria bacterium]
GFSNPSALDIKPRLRVSDGKISRIKFSEYGNNPPGEGDAPKTGTINNLVVYIRFADESEFTDQTSVYNTMFNNSASGANSMYNYFKEVSYNQLSIISTYYPVPPGSVVISYQDSHVRNYYKPYDSLTNPIGYLSSERTIREHTLLKDAVENIASQVPVSLNIDGDNDGRVDNVCFIISGSTTAWSTLLWPHRWALYSYSAMINGKRVYDYNFQLQNSLKSSGPGVLCHEMFHSLGAPDLYHYTSNGISPCSRWDVMDYNSNPPQHMGAYMKWKYGNWISNIPVISSGTHSLKPLTSQTNNCYRVNSPYTTTEYFILEYRKKLSTFENSIPDNGLIVYRINTLYNGNANGPPDEVY